jgi:CHAT domain-containing protein
MTSRYEESLRYYEEARDIIETLGMPIQLGTTWGYIGNVLYQTGDLERAVSAYEKALEIYGEDGKGFVHPARTGLANVYSILGESKRALPLYEEQLSLAVSQDDQHTQASSLMNIAFVHTELGDPAASLRELGRAREIQEALGDTLGLARTMNAVGRAYSSLGNTTLALEAYREADGLAAQSGSRDIRAVVIMNMGSVYAAMLLYERAIESYEEAGAIYEEIGAAHEVRHVLARIANVHWNIGYKEGDAGEYSTALELYQEAFALNEEIGDRVGTIRMRTAIANCLAGMGRLEEARQSYRSAATVAEELGRTDIEWTSYLGMADCFEQAGMLDSARVYNDRAIEIMETSRGKALSEETKAAFLGQRAFVYETQVHVLGKLYRESGKDEYAREAFAAAERGKARALLDAMAEGRVDLDSGVTPELVEERTALERSIATVQYRMRLAEEEGAPGDSIKAFKRQLRALENDLGQVLEKIRLNNPRFAAMDAGEPSDPGAIQQSLLNGKKDRVLLEYSLGDSASYLWAMTGKDVKLHVLPPRPEIEPLVRDLRKGLTTPGANGDSALVATSAELYRILLAPVAREIDKAKLVYVVPDGVLSIIPFEVLLREAREVPGSDVDAVTRNRFFAGLSYAFEDREVRYGPSATTLAMLMSDEKKDTRGLSLLAVGDPVFGDRDEEAGLPAEPEPEQGPKSDDDGGGLRGGLDPLPFTRDEVETISGFFDEDRATVLLGEDAREARLTEPGFLADFDIVHFATHGLIDERRPERSKLALSFPEDPSEDGYLQASEIYRLDLGADLVVLSACETGLGRMVRGEGVLGLPRAFFYAGASSVVVSLWSVSDQSTSRLMAAFYERMISRGESPARALAGAKADLRKEGEFAHPFYWSPFVVMGTF